MGRKFGIAAAVALLFALVVAFGLALRRSAPPGSTADTFRAAGLEWLIRPPKSEMSWEKAQAYCSGRLLAGGGWRLPTKEELQALYQAKSESRPLATFPGMDGGRFWSSSSNGPSGKAWYVAFQGTSDFGTLDTSTGLKVRCARSSEH